MSVLASFDTIPAALHFLADFIECVTPQDLPAGAGPPAVVFDIDDTMLSASEPTTEVTTVKLFWDLCGDLGLRRFIVTARPHMVLSNNDTNEAFTIRELHSHGITDWVKLYMMPYTEYKRCKGNAGPYKERVRRDIVNNHNDGEPLMVNIGDQWGDMSVDSATLDAKYGDEGVHVGFFDATAIVGVKLPAK